MSPLTPRGRILIAGAIVDAFHGAAALAQALPPAVAPSIGAAPIAQRPDDTNDPDAELAPRLSYTLSTATAAAIVSVPFNNPFKVTRRP